MKKVVIIVVVALFAVISIGTYLLLINRPATRTDGLDDSDGFPNSAPLHEAESSREDGKYGTPPAAGDIQKEETIQAAIARIGPEKVSRRVMGARTELTLFGGGIGYVDVDSIVQNRDPYSVIALWQKHGALTGAGESLELEISDVFPEGTGYSAGFEQVIGGIPTAGRGRVRFDATGTVSISYSDLVDPDSANRNSVRIQQAEALVLARQAAARFVEPRRPRFEESQKSLIIETYGEGELQYVLGPGPGDELRSAWLLKIGTFNPYDALAVLIDAETGDVLSTKSVVKKMAVRSTTGCADVDFRVCDATRFNSNQCIDQAVVFGQRGDGTWGCYPNYSNPRRQEEKSTNAIVLGTAGGTDTATMAHEVFHAVFEEYSGPIEHGMVFALTALHAGGSNASWDRYNLRTPQTFFSVDV